MTGFDAGKKVKGRKRHLVVDTLGLLLAVSVTAASVQDCDAAAPVVAQACAKVPGLKKLYADAAYGGKCAEAIEHAHGISVEIVRHPGNRSTGTWQDAQHPLGRMPSPAASSYRPSAGSLNARMPGTSAPDASLPITTAPHGRR